MQVTDVVRKTPSLIFGIAQTFEKIVFSDAQDNTINFGCEDKLSKTFEQEDGNRDIDISLSFLQFTIELASYAYIGRKHFCMRYQQQSTKTCLKSTKLQAALYIAQTR